MAGRAARRRVCNLISEKECGRTTSSDDAQLRAAFGGRRNKPFATLEELELIEEQYKEFATSPAQIQALEWTSAQPVAGIVESDA